MHGLGSRIQESSKPLAWIGLRGTTSLRPGEWAKKASTLCEWYRAPWPTAPHGVRIVNLPQSNKLPDRYRNFAASFTILKEKKKLSQLLNHLYKTNCKVDFKEPSRCKLQFSQNYNLNLTIKPWNAKCFLNDRKHPFFSKISQNWKNFKSFLQKCTCHLSNKSFILTSVNSWA